MEFDSNGTINIEGFRQVIEDNGGALSTYTNTGDIPSCEMCQKTYRDVTNKNNEKTVKTAKLLTCSSCKSAFYCSKKCQKDYK